MTLQTREETEQKIISKSIKRERERQDCYKLDLKNTTPVDLGHSTHLAERVYDTVVFGPCLRRIPTTVR